MFRSTRRPVVFSQAEHARFSARLAGGWGNQAFERPPLAFDAFVRGVELHDRGYGELDADGIGEVPRERWLEIQRLGFEPAGDDPVVDLVVALHVHRLVSRSPGGAEVGRELEAALPELRAAAGVGEAEARAADAITDLCDRVSFDVCFEEESRWSLPVPPRTGAEPVEIAFAYDGTAAVTLDPWPLGPPSLNPALLGYRAEGYPARLEPVIETILIRPG